MELDAGVVREAGRDRQAVGDDGERRLQRERSGEPGDRRSGVQDHCAVVRQFGDGGLRDAVLLVGRRVLAFGEVGLEVQAPGRYRAAVHPAYETRAVQGLQIAADGLRGDLELLGQ